MLLEFDSIDEGYNGFSCGKKKLPSIAPLWQPRRYVRRKAGTLCCDPHVAEVQQKP